MKKGKKAFLGAALVLLSGAGMIFGNQMLASYAFAKDTQTEPAIVLPENETSARSLSNVGMYSSSEGAAYMALRDADKDIDIREVRPTTIAENPSSQPENPTDGILSEEEAKQIGTNAIIQKYGLSQNDIGTFDVTVRGAYVAEWPSTVADKLFWFVQLTPVSLENNPKNMHYGANFSDVLEEEISVYGVSVCIEGTPSAGEISSEKAEEIAIDAITKKYALTKETLDRFTVTTKYYEMTPEAPDKHAWWVNLYPTNVDEFTEIGCYWAYLDAETGETLQLNSAADGKG